MTDQLTCPGCGKPVNATMKFCRGCGMRLDLAPAELVCPTCGSTMKAGYRFCKVCGGSLDSSQNAAPAHPVSQSDPSGNSGTGAEWGARVESRADGTHEEAFSVAPAAFSYDAPAVPAAPVAASAAGAAPQESKKALKFDMQGGFGKAQSKLNDFMGSSVDVSGVGVGFDPSEIQLDVEDEAALSAAFAHFGKSYSPQGQPASTFEDLPVERRTQIESEDAEAQTKEVRDFGVNEAGAFYGEFATKLQAGAAPKVAAVESSHDEAARRQGKNRLKRKVALGEMDKNEAIQKAEG